MHYVCVRNWHCALLLHTTNKHGGVTATAQGQSEVEYWATPCAPGTLNHYWTPCARMHGLGVLTMFPTSFSVASPGHLGGTHSMVCRVGAWALVIGDIISGDRQSM